MKELIIVVLVIWIGYHVIRFVFVVLGEILAAMAKTSAQVHRSSKAGLHVVEQQTRDLRATYPLLTSSLTSDAFFIALLSVGFLIALSPIWFVRLLDHAALNTPLFGWALAGGIVGVILGGLAHYSEVRPQIGRTAVDRVPDLEQLRAGEAAASRIYASKKVLGIASLFVVLVFVGLSWNGNSIYSTNTDTQKKLHLVGTADQLGARTARVIFHAALEDADLTLDKFPEPGWAQDHGEALKLLLAIGRAAAASSTAAIHRLGDVATARVESYQRTIEQGFTNGDVRTYQKARAFEEVNKAQSLSWQARLHRTGSGGAKYDLFLAFDKYEESANLANGEASKALSSLARESVQSSTQTIRNKAYAYYEKQLPTKDPWAYLYLGIRLHKGDGVALNSTVAKTYLLNAFTQTAVSSARTSAFQMLTTIAASDAALLRQLDEEAPRLAVAKDQQLQKLAYDFLETRAQAGDHGAQLWAGYRYRSGQGGAAVDRKKAREWFLKALQSNSATINERAVAALLDLRDSSGR